MPKFTELEQAALDLLPDNFNMYTVPELSKRAKALGWFEKSTPIDDEMIISLSAALQAIQIDGPTLFDSEIFSNATFQPEFGNCQMGQPLELDMIENLYNNLEKHCTKAMEALNSVYEGKQVDNIPTFKQAHRLVSIAFDLICDAQNYVLKYRLRKIIQGDEVAA